MRSVIAILIVLLMSSVVFAQSGGLTGKYQTKQCKKDGDTCGELTFLETMVKKKDGSTVQGAGFAIHSESVVNAKRGDVRVRELGDTDAPKFAGKIGENRFVFTEDGDDMCTMVFDFSKTGTVTIKSKDCDGYFDNTYRKVK